MFKGPNLAVFVYRDEIVNEFPVTSNSQNAHQSNRGIPHSILNNDISHI